MADPEFVKREEVEARAGVDEGVRGFQERRPEGPAISRADAGTADASLSADARVLLVEALNDQDSQTRISAIWALGSSGDPSVAPEIERQYQSDDAGVRKMAVYALGSLPAGTGDDTLVRGAGRFASGRAVERRDRAGQAWASRGFDVLRRMLDRAYVERNVTRQQQPREEVDPVGEVMISGLRAIGALKETALSEQVKALSTDDQNLRVRQAAMETLKNL